MGWEGKWGAKEEEMMKEDWKEAKSTRGRCRVKNAGRKDSLACLLKKIHDKHK